MYTLDNLFNTYLAIIIKYTHTTIHTMLSTILLLTLTIHIIYIHHIHTIDVSVRRPPRRMAS